MMVATAQHPTPPPATADPTPETSRPMRHHALLTFLLVLGAVALPGLAAEAIPAHPQDLEYGPLEFDVPDASAHRHTLENGIPVYVVEDHALPLVDITVSARIGSFLEPDGKAGLASLTGGMMRQGGTASLSAEDFDERADFLAAQISASIGNESGSFRLNSLSGVLDESLDLFFDMLVRPRFQESRLEVAKSDLLEQLKQRNDDPRPIQSREWQWLLYGPDHFTSSYPTGGSVEAISRQDLVDFHRRSLRPEGMAIAVAGDVDAAAIVAALDERFARFETDDGAIAWPPPRPNHTPRPGLYHVEKDIPQSRVQIGHLGLEWTDWSDPGHYAVMVMNDVLGGGGFTSRLTKRIRSDEGLAYSAGSRYGIDTFAPGTFYAAYQSKNATVGYAAKIVQEEIERIRTEPVSDEELRTAKASFIDTFPRQFESSAAIAGRFAWDDFIDRPHSYWNEYRERIRAVGADEVLTAAQQHLHPDRLITLVVGPWDEITGDESDPRGDLVEVSGPVTHLPLRDPVSLEPMTESE